jgi:outer membrane lipoprotein SlyB
MKALEDQVLKLIKDYCAAPDEKKEEVYERGERRLMRSVRIGTVHHK